MSDRRLPVLVTLVIVVFAVVALILVRVVRHGGPERDVAAFAEGQEALRRASKRTPRSSP